MSPKFTPLLTISSFYSQFFSPIQKKKSFRISKVKKDDYEFSSPSSSHTDVNVKLDDQMMLGKDREVSPELAKIAPLITRPPKQKPSSEYFCLF
jgi:hypothetical protein